MGRIVGQKHRHPAHRRSLATKPWLREIFAHPDLPAPLRISRKQPIRRTGTVATASTLPSFQLIELASARLNNIAAETTHNQASEAKAKHDQAMARRLAQLQVALGNTATPEAKSVEPHTSSPISAPSQPGNTGKLWMAGLISALAGAGLTAWLSAQQAAPTTPQPTVQELVTAAPTHLAAALPPTVATLPAVPKMAERQQVAELLEAWRAAWASRDVTTYLGFYSPSFSPNDGSSRSAWAAGRQKKLAAGPQIALSIKDLVIERIDDRQFKATYRQDYTAGNYREVGTPKTLIITRHASGWQIIQELQR